MNAHRPLRAPRGAGRAERTVAVLDVGSSKVAALIAMVGGHEEGAAPRVIGTDPNAQGPYSDACATKPAISVDSDHT